MSETASEGNSRFSWLSVRRDNKSTCSGELWLGKGSGKEEKSPWSFVNTLCWNTWHQNATKTHHLFIQTEWYLFRNSFLASYSLRSTKNCNLFATLPCRLSLSSSSIAWGAKAAKHILDSGVNFIISQISEMCWVGCSSLPRTFRIHSICEVKKSQHVKFHFLDAHWIRTMLVVPSHTWRRRLRRCYAEKRESVIRYSEGE